MSNILSSSIMMGLCALATALLIGIGIGCDATSGNGAGSSATGSLSNKSGDPMERLTVPDEAPPVGTSTRVGGDVAAKVKGSDGDYEAGWCSVDTPLPVGYPQPTPPGAIDLKTYPSVRLAEVVGSGDPDDGMNKTFWPLFNHIKEHDIAMTAPVEMNYRGMQGSDQSEPQSWSMAFLYREPELNQTGVEGRVVVRDCESVTVVSIGMKGSYSMSLAQSGMKEIENWLATNPQWEAAGDWRSLCYNGPQLLWWNKWSEVQVPVRKSKEYRLTPTELSNTATGLIR